jgi:phage I-like protein
MASFQAHGVDLVIDLEHLSLDDSSPNFDPDARGWCALEVREGELWAVNVRWTSDGQARLGDKRQRYVSPAFAWDRETGRVTRIVNIALTAMPATHETPALVAAREESTGMDPKQIETIMKALGLDPKMMGKVASALGLEADADVDAVKSALDAFVAKMDKIKGLVDDAEEKKEGESEEPQPSEVPAPEPPPAAMSSHDKLVAAVEALTAKLAAREAESAAKAEADERSGLVSSRKWPAELVGWASDSSTPLAEVKRLSVRFPLAEAPVPQAANTTPTQGSPVSGLSERELKICKDTGCAPEKFAALKAAREAAQKGRS